MLKMKLQYFGHLIWRANSLERTLMLGKIEGRRRRGQMRMRLLDGIIDSMNMSLSKLREKAKDREACHAAVHVVKQNWTWLSDWTTEKKKFICELIEESSISFLIVHHLTWSSFLKLFHSIAINIVLPACCCCCKYSYAYYWVVL